MRALAGKTKIGFKKWVVTEVKQHPGLVSNGSVLRLNGAVPHPVASAPSVLKEKGSTRQSKTPSASHGDIGHVEKGVAGVSAQRQELALQIILEKLEGYRTGINLVKVMSCSYNLRIFFEAYMFESGSLNIDIFASQSMSIS